MGEHYPVYTLIGETESGERHAQSILFLEVVGSEVIVGNMEHKMGNIQVMLAGEYAEYMGSLAG